MRLGLYGGTFDPVHYGHLLLAEQCREQCRLDAVWFLPSGLPPHKQGAAITDGKRRLEMLELAVAGHPEFAVNGLELERSGPTFTVDTLQQLHDEQPERELFFLIGADSLVEFPTWRSPERIAELATLVAVNRGGQPQPDLTTVREQLGDEFVSRIQFVTMPGLDLASREMRGRIHADRSIRFMTPRSVEMYIEQHGLYRDAP